MHAGAGADMRRRLELRRLPQEGAGGQWQDPCASVASIVVWRIVPQILRDRPGSRVRGRLQISSCAGADAERGWASTGTGTGTSTGRGSWTFPYYTVTYRLVGGGGRARVAVRSKVEGEIASRSASSNEGDSSTWTSSEAERAP